MVFLRSFYSFVSFWSTMLAISASAIEEDSPEEIVCQSKFFRAKCPSEDEVIQMQRARYGRMNLSKCVRENFGYIGCSNDVLDILDSHCSGRHSCSLRILDENFFNMKPCHEDLKSYLAVEYSCIEVVNPRSYACQQDKPAIVSLQRGQLASVVSTETGCGSAHAPWHIQVLLGQRVNVTLFDFSWVSTTRTPGPSNPVEEGRHCKMYALLREPDQSTGVTVCGGGQGRVKAVYVSRSEHLEVVMVTAKNPARSAPAFVLAYEAVGCPDMEAPPGGWVQRNEDVAILGCAHSSDLWHLYCRGTAWIGQFRNCTPETFKDVDQEVFGMNLTFPYELVAIILLTMAFSFGLVILVVGIVCLARLQRRFAYNSIDDVRCQSDDKREQSRSPMATVVTMTTGGDDVGSAEQPKRRGWSWGGTHSLRRQSTYVTCAYPDCCDGGGDATAVQEKATVAPPTTAGVEHSPMEAWRCMCERCAANHQNFSNQQQQDEQQEQLTHYQDQHHPYHQHHHRQEQPHLHNQEHHHHSQHHPGSRTSHFRSSGLPPARSLVRIIQPDSRSPSATEATLVVGSAGHRRRASNPHDGLIAVNRHSCCPPDVADSRGDTNTW